MVIQAVAAQKPAKLISKVVGKAVESGSKIIGKNGLSITAPTAAKTYDVITGIGKKGEFQLFSFRDEANKVIQHYTRYLRDNNKYTDVIIDKEVSVDILNRAKRTVKGSIGGGKTTCSTEYTSLVPCMLPNNKIIFQKNFMTTTPKGDFGGAEVLQHGKKAMGIKFKYNWDGKPTQIEYMNAQGKQLDITDVESQYLPFVFRKINIIDQNGQPTLVNQDFTDGRLNEKIALSQKIQERLHGIQEGFLPKVKAVKEKDLVAVKATGKTPEQLAMGRGGMHIGGEALPSGQIHIIKDTPTDRDGLVILDRISHEMQHESDFIKMYRGGGEALDEALKKVGKTYDERFSEVASEKSYYSTDDFTEKCMKLGQFKKGTPEYNEAVDILKMNLEASSACDLKDQVSHDALLFEQRAINREIEQINMFQQVQQKVNDFLANLLV